MCLNIHSQVVACIVAFGGASMQTHQLTISVLALLRLKPLLQQRSCLMQGHRF